MNRLMRMASGLMLMLCTTCGLAFAAGAAGAALGGQDILTTISQLLENPVARGVLLYLGGFLVTRNEAFVKKAVPFLLLAASTLVSLVQAMFPALVPAAHAAVEASASAPHAPWWMVLVNTAAAAAVAVGLHSGPKNHREWVEMGYQLWHELDPPK